MDKQALFDPLGDHKSALELLGYVGSDLTVVNAARVSYAKESAEFSDQDARLIRYLMRNKHGTPFEHVVYQFRVRAPLFVVHQWERHRMASYNEESGRYVELRGDFYIAEDTWAAEERRYTAAAFAFYRHMLANGAEKERARSVLPSSLYKEFWWTVNARSLMNFLELRTDEHAQREIRLYAQALEEMFAANTPALAAAFRENGRIAP
jgi:thymidylate synthase (FAD)